MSARAAMRHDLIDMTGRAAASGYAPVGTCRCGRTFTAVAPRKRAARRQVRARHRGHLAEVIR